jgi:hypothetical protein
MDTTTSAIATGVVVTVGRWAQGNGVEAKTVIGAGIFAIILSLIDSGQPKLAANFGMLVLVAALFRYTIPIAKKLGYTK